MGKRIKAKELPEFDAAAYLDDEAAIAAYLMPTTVSINRSADIDPSLRSGSQTS